MVRRLQSLSCVPQHPSLASSSTFIGDMSLFSFLFFFFFIVEPFIKTWFSSQIKMELTAEVNRSPVTPHRSPLERWAEMGAEQPGHNNEGHQLVWRTASAHSHLINGLLQWQNRSKRRRSKAPWGSTGGFCHNTPPSQNALSFSPLIDLLTEWTFLRNRNRFA